MMMEKPGKRRSISYLIIIIISVFVSCGVVINLHLLGDLLDYSRIMNTMNLAFDATLTTVTTTTTTVNDALVVTSRNGSIIPSTSRVQSQLQSLAAVGPEREARTIEATAITIAAATEDLKWEVAEIATTATTTAVTARTVTTQRPVQIPVFYNVFSSPAKVSRVSLSKSIVKEQISLLLPNHELFVRSIGVPFEIKNATLIRHDSEGDEAGTLNLLWQYCRKHTTDTVVYIHNKGSFHASRNNNKLRKFMTRGALSQACMNMPLTCNVCSSRMSPFPYPHTSGNMWAARCEYIQKLIDPLVFAAKMNVVRHELCKNCTCFPFGRFSSEAWVYSHANSMPCDVSAAESFSWSYDGIPEGNFEIKLEPAPRFERKMYEKKVCPKMGRSAEYRLLEYQALYNETVGKSWWGWKFFNFNQSI